MLEFYEAQMMHTHSVGLFFWRFYQLGLVWHETVDPSKSTVGGYEVPCARVGGKHHFHSVTRIFLRTLPHAWADYSVLTSCKGLVRFTPILPDQNMREYDQSVLATLSIAKKRRSLSAPMTGTSK